MQENNRVIFYSNLECFNFLKLKRDIFPKSTSQWRNLNSLPLESRPRQECLVLLLVNIILEVEAPHSKEGKKEKVQGLGGIK